MQELDYLWRINLCLLDSINYSFLPNFRLVFLAQILVFSLKLGLKLLQILLDKGETSGVDLRSLENLFSDNLVSLELDVVRGCGLVGFKAQLWDELEKPVVLSVLNVVVYVLIWSNLVDFGLKDVVSFLRRNLVLFKELIVPISLLTILYLLIFSFHLTHVSLVRVETIDKLPFMSLKSVCLVSRLEGFHPKSISGTKGD